MLTTKIYPTPYAFLGANFGEAVAPVGDNMVIVGTPKDVDGFWRSGAAYLFHTDGTFLTKFLKPKPQDSDRFGAAVSGVGSDKVLIGAPDDDTGAEDAGAAYLFSTNGSLLTTFTNPTPAIQEGFGFAVAGVSSDKVLIGAPQDDTGGTYAGAAYLFSTNGTLLTVLSNPTPESGDSFGWAVSAVGKDKVLIGAWFDDTGSTNAGAAYLFSTNGTLLTTITNPVPENQAYFGFGVSGVGEDKVVVGAWGANANAGAAYLFSTNGTLLLTFADPVPESAHPFGAFVTAVGEDKVLITDGRTNSAVACLFSTNGTLLTTFTNPVPQSDNGFTRAIAGVGSDKVVIGAPSDKTLILDGGAAYIYQYQPTPTHYVNIANTFPVPPFTNWATAATNIQDAVDAACAGDTVLVTNGVYAAGGRAVYGTMTNRVGVDKPLSLRSVNGPEVTTIDGLHAVPCATLLSGVVMSGFTLANGDLFGVLCTSGVLSNCVVSGADGQGVLSSPSRSATLNNCTLIGNRARGPGGGANNCTLNDCMIISNSTFDVGGGAYRCTLNRCTLIGNSAWEGGGAFECDLKDCTLIGNSAIYGGGATLSTLNNCILEKNFVERRGIYEAEGSGAGSCALTNCMLTENWSEYPYGRAVANSTLFNCTLVKNQVGGASSSTLIDCTLTDNIGRGAVGSELTNCILFGNRGGASYSTLDGCVVISNRAETVGGGVYECTLNNCTVVGNSSDVSGGASFLSTLNNCIAYYNDAPSLPNYDHRYGGEINYTCTYPMPTNGVGNITNAPLFVNTNNWADLRLRPDSPCIDAGNNDFVTWATDLDGHPRILNGIVDMGAYEFVPLTPAELVEQLIAQVNASGLQHKQPLLATLNAALASIQRGNCHSAVGQLGAFQNKVQAQVTDTVLANELITSASQVITALDCPVAKISSLKLQANGLLQMQIEGAANQVYLIEASTNLLDWQTVGVTSLQADGSFEFEDPEAPQHRSRFYRLVTPR